MSGTFPELQNKPDASLHKEDQEDTGMSNQMEGGYVVSRPRFTRKPRKTFTIGYTNIPNDDFLKLQEFWDAMRGSAGRFLWVNPMTGKSYDVRFKKGTQWSSTYIGAGINKRWNVHGIVLEEI